MSHKIWKKSISPRNLFDIEKLLKSDLNFIRSFFLVYYPLFFIPSLEKGSPFLYPTTNEQKIRIVKRKFLQFFASIKFLHNATSPLIPSPYIPFVREDSK